MRVKKSAVVYVEKEKEQPKRKSKNDDLELIADGVYAKKNRKHKYYELNSRNEIIGKKGDLPSIDHYG